MIQQAVSPECEPEAKRIPALLRCYLRCPSSPHAALGGCFLFLPTGSLRLNSNPYVPRQAAALGTLRTHFLVMLLEALHPLRQAYYVIPVCTEISHHSSSV